jgi:hypothetical protein
MNRCARCHRDLGIWCHQGAVSHHEWKDSEGGCSCGPLAFCAACDVGVIRAHGFVLLEEEASPMSTTARH